MEKNITFDNVRNFAYINDKICKKPIRGVVIHFMGLNENTVHFIQTPLAAEFYAEQGILYVMPYNNTWAWMNRQAVAFTDEIMDAVFAGLSLDENIPVVSSGRSMGGQSCLVYANYAKRTPAACVANCPVCDVPYHYTERPDLPRTMYSAVYWEEGTMEERLERISPLHLAEGLPKIPYHIFHCDRDECVNIKAHSDIFVEKMKQLGHTITYDVQKDRGHVDLSLDMWRKYHGYVTEAIFGKNNK